MLTSSSCVKAGDIDNDGNLDLFIGGRLVPESYPLAPRSYILKNNGKGYFSDVTELYSKSLMYPGMVTDAVWTDFNGDKQLLKKTLTSMVIWITLLVIWASTQ